jgi:aspartyl-tRNA(Asn)/glutamyl-tRNA(Gln) amidotransferase subunit A
MDEFGMGSTTESSAFHSTRNPWDTDHVPGGSSGGSATAVAANQCAAALGSDTGGSIRQPAAFCGVVGVKPTYGRVSRHGLVAYASSLDTIGPLAHSVAGAAAVLAAISGADSMDSTCSGRGVGDLAIDLLPAEALASRPLQGKRLAIIKETMGEGVDPGVAASVAAAADHLRSLGAEVGEVSLPSFIYGLPAYYVLALSEASSNLARYDGVRYGPRAQAAGEVSILLLVIFIIYFFQFSTHVLNIHPLLSSAHPPTHRAAGDVQCHPRCWPGRRVPPPGADGHLLPVCRLL